MDGSTRANINSPKSLREEHKQEKWPTDWSRLEQRQTISDHLQQVGCMHERVGTPVGSISTQDFDSMTEMTVQEKVEHWNQAGCFTWVTLIPFWVSRASVGTPYEYEINNIYDFEYWT